VAGRATQNATRANHSFDREACDHQFDAISGPKRGVSGSFDPLMS
jgi:hypothetical protein